MPLNIDKMVALFEKIPIVLSDTGDSTFYTCDRWPVPIPVLLKNIEESSPVPLNPI